MLPPQKHPLLQLDRPFGTLFGLLQASRKRCGVNFESSVISIAVAFCPILNSALTASEWCCDRSDHVLI